MAEEIFSAALSLLLLDEEEVISKICSTILSTKTRRVELIFIYILRVTRGFYFFVCDERFLFFCLFMG